MNFPHKETDWQAPILRRDYRTILSHAISRQGNSHTARAMMAVLRSNNGLDDLKRDKVRARIQYFASAAEYFNKDNSPHGSFLPTNSAERTANSNCKDAVYQAPLINSKSHMLSNASFETKTDFAGQETLRTI